MVVTIVDMAGAGKSTVARGGGKRLGYRHVDTGEMYRELTAVALDRGVSLNDGEALAALRMVPATALATAVVAPFAFSWLKRLDRRLAPDPARLRMA